MLSLFDRKVAIEPIEKPDRYGHIILPDTVKGNAANQGIVKYIAHDCESPPPLASHVIFSAYAGTVTNIEGEGKLIILKEYDIVAVIEDDPFIVEGVYFLDKNSKPFKATYEAIISLIAKHFKDDFLKRDHAEEYQAGFHQAKESELKK